MKYHMVTVKLNHAAVEKEQAMSEIKAALNLAHPTIDEDLGAIPMPEIINGKVGYKDEYVVMIAEIPAMKLASANHPNVIMVHESTEEDMPEPEELEEIGRPEAVPAIEGAFTLDEVRKAKKSLSEQFKAATDLPLAGVGIRGNEDDGYYIGVNLSREPAEEERKLLPDEHDGVRVDYRIVKSLKALPSA